MNSSSSDYEQFIMSLIDNVKGTYRNISDLGYGRNNTITGMCGQPHQIDVSFVDHDFEHPTLVIIECKRRTDDRIKLEHVKVVKATIDDILIAEDAPDHAKAIIVTTKGAQEGAQRFADYYGIMIENVPHRPDYIFRYENIVQAGITVSIQACSSVTADIHRYCQSCGKRFKVHETEKLCQNCAASRP